MKPSTVPIALSPARIVLLVIFALLATSCQGETAVESVGEVDAERASAVATDKSSTTDPISDAVTLGIADCFDPLHDTDGSGGFVEFCERVERAEAAGKLDCFRPDFEPGSLDCASWRIERDEIPFYYFDVEPAPPATEPEQEPRPPAQAPPAQQEPAEPPPPADAPPAQQEPAEPPPPADAPPAQQEPAEPPPSTELGEQPAATGEPTPMPPRPPADDPTVQPGSPTGGPILVVTEFGGCQMVQLCRTIEIFDDGQVAATIGTESRFAEVNLGLVIAVIENSGVDADALQAALPTPGRCEAAVDGISLAFSVIPAGLEVDTCMYNLADATDPLMLSVLALTRAAFDALPA